MIKRNFFIASLLLLVIACRHDGHRTKINNLKETEEATTELMSDSNNYIPNYEKFVNHVLKDKVRKHDFEYVIKNCRHQELFPVDGLQEIIAYSDKRYPKTVSPSYYEHFILFCFKYTNTNQAKLNFDNFYLTSQLDTSKYDQIEQSLVEKHEKIKIASKPGGLIVQKNEYIFSLVETCGETPIGGNWVDYENLFLGYIGNNQQDSLTVLNADCGRLEYIKVQRTTLNNR